MCCSLTSSKYEAVGSLQSSAFKASYKTCYWRNKLHTSVKPNPSGSCTSPQHFALVNVCLVAHSTSSGAGQTSHLCLWKRSGKLKCVVYSCVNWKCALTVLHWINTTTALNNNMKYEFLPFVCLIFLSTPNAVIKSRYNMCCGRQKMLFNFS